MKSQDSHLFSTRCIQCIDESRRWKVCERKTSHLPGDYCQLSVQLAVLQLSNHLLTSKIGIDDRVLVIIDRRLTDTSRLTRIDTMTRVKTCGSRRCCTRGRRKLNSLSSDSWIARRVFCVHALRYISPNICPTSSVPPQNTVEVI